MKQTLKTVSTFIAALSMVLILSITAFAADAKFEKSYKTGSSYTNVASIRTSNKIGLNCNVCIFSYSTSMCDIRMLGKNGKTVWEGKGVIAMGNHINTFWCGTDVYTVQIRAQSGGLVSGNSHKQ